MGALVTGGARYTNANLSVLTSQLLQFTLHQHLFLYLPSDIAMGNIPSVIYVVYISDS